MIDSIARFNRFGMSNVVSVNFASAEAMSQALPVEDGVRVQECHLDGPVKVNTKWFYWVPLKQRIEAKPDVALLPIGLRVLIAKTTRSEKLLNKLADDDDFIVRYTVFSNGRTQEVALDRIQHRERQGMLKDLKTLAKSEFVTPAILDILADYPSKDVMVNVADNPRTPPNALARLSRLLNAEILENVSQNENTPPEALERIFRGNNWVLNVGVAGNKNTPLHLLLELLKVQNSFVTAAVKSNETYQDAVARGEVQP